MPNLFQFADWITLESLRILVNKSQVSQFFNTQYNREFTREFAVGETVRVKIPQRFLIRDGMGYTPQALDRKYTTVVLDQFFGVDFEWDSAEKALKMERGEDQIRREYIEPAMAQIASEIESRCILYAYQNTNNYQGTLGTTPVTMAPYHQARQRLNELSCPPGERGLIVSPGMMNTLTSTAANLTWTNPANEISRAFKEGYYGRAAGFDWYESPALYDHTSGTKLTANAATIQAVPAQGATSVTVSGTAAQTFLKGDIFVMGTSWATMTGCRAVNPVTRRSTGTLKQFVVTQDLTLTGGSTDVLYFKPAIYGPGSPYQNVDALPVASTTTCINWPAQTVTASVHGINGLALHGDAFAMVSVKLETPTAVEIASQTRDPETGLSVRFIRQFDATTSKMINRFDVLLGFGDLYPDNCACRVVSLI